MGDIIHKEFPWCSKSRLNSFEFCKLAYWFRYIKGQKAERNYAMDYGLTLHEIAEVAPEFLSYGKIKDVADDIAGVVVHKKVVEYIVDVLLQMVPEEVYPGNKIYEGIRNYATYEMQRFMRFYNNELLSDDECEAFYDDWLTETNYFDGEEKLYGRADAIQYDISPSGVIKRIVIDFKTGWCPKFAQDHSKSIPTSKRIELMFYMYLYSKNSSFEIDELIGRYVYLTPAMALPHMRNMEFSKRTLSAMFRHYDKLREEHRKYANSDAHWHNIKPNKYVCRKCGYKNVCEICDCGERG